MEIYILYFHKSRTFTVKWVHFKIKVPITCGIKYPTCEYRNKIRY